MMIRLDARCSDLFAIEQMVNQPIYVHSKHIMFLKETEEHMYAVIHFPDGSGCIFGVTRSVCMFRIHSSENERVRLWCKGLNHPVQELVNELRYNPDCGSRVAAAKKSFEERVAQNEYQ